jgi:hypothetical protein
MVLKMFPQGFLSLPKRRNAEQNRRRDNMVLRIFLISTLFFGCGVPHGPKAPPSEDAGENGDDEESADQLPDGDKDPVDDPEKPEPKPAVLTKTVKLAVGDADCPFGGIEEITYEDIDGSGDLSDGDNATSKFICNDKAPVIAFDAGYAARAAGVDFVVQYVSEKPAADWVVSAMPKFGTLSGAFPNFHYTPNVGHKGSDEVVFRVEDVEGFRSNEARAVFVTKSKIVFIGEALNLRPIEDQLQSQMAAHFEPDTMINIPPVEVPNHLEKLAAADLVIIKPSALLDSSVVSAVEGLTKPVLVWNQNYYQALRMQNFPGSLESFVQLEVQDVVPSVTYGYVGNQDLYAQSFVMSYSKPGSDAIIIGSKPSSPTEAAVFLYPKDSKLAQGNKAPHHRAGFLDCNIYSSNSWKDDGLELFLRLSGYMFLN